MLMSFKNPFQAKISVLHHYFKLKNGFNIWEATKCKQQIYVFEFWHTLICNTTNQSDSLLYTIVNL